jgi:threonine/homoserine/homoserine lactone efflux protein
MDTFSLFISSMIIGLSIAAPVGPIGVLCIRRTLVEGRFIGFVSGLGAATADATYGLIAALGLTAFTSILVDSAGVLRVVGGLFMLYLGYRTLTSTPAEKAKPEDTKRRGGWLGAYLSIFALTITNPMTILSFLSIFAGLSGSATAARTPATSFVMVLGIFAGSAVWWLVLSGGVSLLRERMTPWHMLWINRISGAIIVLFALRILLIGG